MLTGEGSEQERRRAVGLVDLQNKWLTKHTTVAQVKEVFAMEQFFNTLSLEKRAWVRDKKPTTCVEAGELADEYELARSQEMQEKSNQSQMKKQGAQRKWCGYCKTTSHAKEECRKLQARSKKETQSSSASKEASR